MIGQSETLIKNAGLRLFEAQKAQGTNLCIGLDPHYQEGSQLNADFYISFASGSTHWAVPDLTQLYEGWQRLVELVSPPSAFFRLTPYPDRSVRFLAGVISYFHKVIDAAWSAGIRVFKPQASFYEAFGPLGGVVLQVVNFRIRNLAERDKVPVFVLLDAKRGDIESTQRPYYDAYLSGFDQEVIPDTNGCFNFDSMTVTAWMGEDVLTPGLPYFRKGKGATVVTRSSNPSGTTLQDLCVEYNDEVELTDKQRNFETTGEDVWQIENLTDHRPTTHEVVLFLTEDFCRRHDLIQEGISPLFSVMGSTVKMDGTFRKLRPTGLALIPGFGHQDGKFENVMPLVITEGPHAGHIGLFASSRGHNYAWMAEYGGSGDPQKMESDLKCAIDQFRQNERQAYSDHGMPYPY